jgi:hypothetical protein
MSSAGKIAWVPVERFAEHRPWCETPRHAGQRRPSAYVVAFVGEGPEDGEQVVYAACERCVEQIAEGLDTTAAEGTLP